MKYPPHKLLFVALCALLSLTNCKKEKATGEIDCNTRSSFLVDVSAHISETALIGDIHQATDGSIHVETYETGNWQVASFTPDGEFTGNTTLGIAPFGKTLTVYDGFYITSYTETNNDTVYAAMVRGWKELREYTTPCKRIFDYDTAQISQPRKSQETTVRKVNFKGETEWVNSFTGYMPKEQAHVLFDKEGNLFVTTFDYKGISPILRSAGVDYEYDDPLRPSFTLTDTILYNYSNSSAIITKVSSTDGSVIEQTSQPVNYFNPAKYAYGDFLYSSAVIGSSVWIHSGVIASVFNTAATFVKDIALVETGCQHGNEVRGIYPSWSGNAYMWGVADGIFYMAKTDEQGNLLWKKNGAVYSGSSFLPTSNDGYALAFDGVYNLYDAAGSQINRVELNTYLKGKAISLCTTSNCDFTSSSTVTCNGNMLHIFSGIEAVGSGGKKRYLVRNQANGSF